MVLRALDRLRGVHQVHAHTGDVAAALAELAAVYDEAPRVIGDLRDKLDVLADDGIVYRLEDASRREPGQVPEPPVQLLDDVGYADSSDIAARLLGLRPTRHAPLGAADSPYAVAAADDAQEDDDEAGIGEVRETER